MENFESKKSLGDEIKSKIIDDWIQEVVDTSDARIPPRLKACDSTRRLIEDYFALDMCASLNPGGVAEEFVKNFYKKVRNMDMDCDKLNDIVCGNKKKYVELNKDGIILLPVFWHEA